MVEKQKDERVKQNALKFPASQLNLVREPLGQGQRQRTKHTLHIEWNIKINKSGDEIHTQIHTHCGGNTSGKTEEDMHKGGHYRYSIMAAITQLFQGYMFNTKEGHNSG